MNDFKATLAAEQERINQLLLAECDLMPESVRPVVEHTLKAGGKRLRPLLTVFMGQVFECRNADLDMLAVMSELVHMASLLHDDVYDNAGTRRGVASAHQIFGSVMAMLTGDVILGHAARQVAKLNRADLVSCFAEAVYQTAAGEAAEIYTQGRVSLDYDSYMEVITGKTAWAFRAACEGAALLAGAPQKTIDAAACFGLNLGIAFQIVDDALDIAPEETTGKPAGGDIREGKCTPPVHLYWKSLPQPEADAFAQQFSSRKWTDDEVEKVVFAMREMNLDGLTREMSTRHVESAVEALYELPDTPGRELLFNVLDYLRERSF